MRQKSNKYYSMLFKLFLLCFKIIIELYYLSCPLSFSKLVTLLALFQIHDAFFISYCYVHVYSQTHKYRLLSLCNVISVCIFRTDDYY